MTPSLAAFFWSLIWAAVLVILPITGAIIWVSQQDKLRRADLNFLFSVFFLYT